MASGGGGGCAELANYDFVEEPAKEFFCAVTLELLVEPQQTDCCGHHFSAEVARRLLGEGKACPMCQQPRFTTHPDKFHGRKIRQLIVRCPNKKSGCGWEGELGDVEAHVGRCPKQLWRCPHCAFVGLREGGEEHLSVCEQFPVVCPNRCETGHVQRARVQQHLLECPQEIVSCEYAEMGCGVRLPRSEMREHVRESGQDHLLKMCAANLSLSRELSRKVAEKEQQITELHRDMRRREEKMSSDMRRMEEKMSSEMRRMEEKMQEQMKGNEERTNASMREREKRMQQQMKEMEGRLKGMVEEGSKKEIEAMSSDMRRMEEKMQEQMKGNEERTNASMREREKRMQQQMKEMEGRLKGMVEEGSKKEIEAMSSDMRCMEEKLQEQMKGNEERMNASMREREKRMQQQMKEMEVMIAKQVTEVESKVKQKVDSVQHELGKRIGKNEKKMSVSMAEMEGRMREAGEGRIQRVLGRVEGAIEENRKEMNTSVASVGRELSVVKSQVAEIHRETAVVIPPVEYTVPNFSVLKAQDKEWRSQPFYTHRGGYKMCIGVWPNGYSFDKGTYVSVTFYKMQDANTETLKWSAKLLVTIQIMNHTTGRWEREHTNNCTRFKPTNECCESTNNYQYLPHSELAPYLKDDFLHIRVSKFIVE